MTASSSASVSRERLLRIPITGSCCCARAAGGHAAAPPTNEMKSRRLMCPQVEGTTVPHRPEADTALCGTANLTAYCQLRVHNRAHAPPQQLCLALPPLDCASWPPLDECGRVSNFAQTPLRQRAYNFF